MPPRSNTAIIEKILNWVRTHPLPDKNSYRMIPVCLWGERGAGKTQLIRTYCAKNQLGFRGFHPAHSTSGSDLVGLQYFDAKIERTVHARPLWLPSEKDPVSWDEKGLIFIDEINRAPRAVLQGLLEPIGEGTIEQSGWKLPPDWGFICAANPPRDGYDVSNLDESLMDRLLHLPLNFDSIRWSVWAQATSISPDLINFNARYPEMIAKNEMSLIDSIDIHPTPRSMEYLARLYEPGMDENMLRLIAEGLIGKEPAQAFIEHVNSSEKPVSGEKIVSGQFQEELTAHLADNREDLIQASQVLLLSTLAAHKFRPEQDQQVLQNISTYLRLLGQKRFENFWQELQVQAPHWTVPISKIISS